MANPPKNRPRTKYSTFLVPRQTDEVSRPAELWLQTEPESENPAAIPTAQAATAGSTPCSAGVPH